MEKLWLWWDQYWVEVQPENHGIGKWNRWYGATVGTGLSRAVHIGSSWDVSCIGHSNTCFYRCVLWYPLGETNRRGLGERRRMARRLWPSIHSKCWAYGWVFTGRKSCVWVSVAHCGSLLIWLPWLAKRRRRALLCVYLRTCIPYWCIDCTTLRGCWSRLSKGVAAERLWTVVW